MFSMKTILAAASLAVLTAAGAGSATAAHWDRDHHGWRDRAWMRHERIEHRAFVNHARAAHMLRFHRYRMIGEPYFVHGRYVVRTYDRFGRRMLIQIDPYSGAFIRVL
ncbi:MAG TPA: hypothetical protein VJL82_09250 [Rhizomicrobium sp.]|nr:hypothetical protein [Rhizomicrobium sp.]